MLSRLWPSKRTQTDATSSHPDGFITPLRSQQLLDTPRRQQLLENIWQRASLSRQQFTELYRHPLERFAELVQQFPASENHHHAHLGGMLDHGLEIVAYALKIRQTFLLPIGAAPESQSAQAEAWSAAAAYGALIHDLGKIAVDLQVELQGGKVWHPWHGHITRPYRFRYVKGRDYQLHGAASALIYSQILTPDILDWLSGFPELWKPLIFVLAGQYEHAGILGEIVVRADQASVAQELGGNPARALAAPKQSLQRQLAEGLRFLVREKYKLNHPDGPADGWLAQDALWLVSKPTADSLRAYLMSQGIEGVPSSNAPFFNMMQDQGVIQTNAQDKAIWKATIDTGRGWRNTFTLLKLSPALIWPDPNDRPDIYTGSVSIEEGATTNDDATAEPILASAPTAETSSFEHQPSSGSSFIEQTPEASKDRPEEIDDLLALFGNITMTSEELATSQTTVADETTAEQPFEHCETKTESRSEESTAMPSSNQDLGLGFVEWLKLGIDSRRIIINDTKALIHTVSGTAMLVTPVIFKRYVQEHPSLEQLAKAQEISAWQLVQRSFEKLKLHRKTKKKLNIWTFDVVGPRKSKQLRGYLLEDPKTIFNETPFDNPSLRLKAEDSEVEQ
ncbi:Integrating conjugative element relaxase, PFL_4751 family [Pseudomonas sp. 8Z]|uniref:MobH family relaxase n=1 Tax=Pseudomonas sp. 8Z TaxID=2653166 RepID=UPI0012F11F1F|nr:MobH family relaxase [Pseudomonas sp. 8Z]VXC22333.1 Integrating conjugative element relaxase, PFL_4751 family [Pseudomonas sp. 8Z]